MLASVAASGGRVGMFKRQSCWKGKYGEKSEEELRAVAQKEEQTTQHTLKVKSQQWTRLEKEQGATERGGVAATSPYLQQSNGIIIWISASRRIVLAWRWLSAVTSAPCHANKSRLDGDQKIRCSTGVCGGIGGPQQNGIQLNYGSAAKISNQPHLYARGQKCIAVRKFKSDVWWEAFWFSMAGDAQITKDGGKNWIFFLFPPTLTLQ